MRRQSRIKPRAPLTGTAFDYILVEVPCPQCGENDPQSLAELVVSDSTVCRNCKARIDLTTEGWRSRLAHESEKYKKIKPITP